MPLRHKTLRPYLSHTTGTATGSFFLTLDKLRITALGDVVIDKVTG